MNSFCTYIAKNDYIKRKKPMKYNTVNTNNLCSKPKKVLICFRANKIAPKIFFKGGSLNFRSYYMRI